MTSPALKQIAGLPKLSQDELTAIWKEYFGVEPPAYRRGFLVRGLAHRIQELTYGGLKPAYQARLDAMIEGKDNPKVRCAVYTRKSSEEGLEQEFNSLHAQRAAGEAYVASQTAEGWLLVPDRYDDGGISGATLERPALKRLLGDVEAGKIDCVVVYKVDRLSRSLTDFAKLVDAFERYGVSFVSVTQHFNTTTSMGRLTLNILLSFAQFEREVIGERIRDKFAASRAKGMWMGGNPPLGYDVRDRKLVVNPAEAELVRLIFRRFLDLGLALLLIRELNAQGHRTKSWTTQAGTFREGRPFDKGTLYKILRNRTYLGEAVHKGKSYPGEHEPIVDRAIWTRVNEVLASNARRRGNEARARTAAPLRGLMRCNHCSAVMTPTHTRRRGRLYRYYVCLGFRASRSRRLRTASSSSLVSPMDQER